MVTYVKRNWIDFFVPLFNDDEWRHVGKGKWKPDRLRTEDEMEESGDLVFVDDIFFEILTTVLGEDNIVETCSGGPDLCFTIDKNVCKLSLKRIAYVAETLYNYMNSGELITTDAEPHTNNYGTPDYHDPRRVIPDFNVPPIVQSALKGKLKLY